MLRAGSGCHARAVFVTIEASEELRSGAAKRLYDFICWGLEPILHLFQGDAAKGCGTPLFEPEEFC